MRFRMIFFITGFFLSSGLLLQAQVKLHTIQVKNPKATHRFFKYSGQQFPLISGHRGGSVPGFPENSIEALENTLKYTPVFFEIDPRLTKDSVIVLLHDATMERTTTGKGKLADYTWEELQNIRLKDIKGQITDFKIPKLEDVIIWARGKTILNLDIKDVPFEMTAALIRKLKAEAFVMVTVHNPEQAKFYYDRIPSITFSAHVKNKKAFEAYDQSGFPWGQGIAYIGSKIQPQNKQLYELLHAKGTPCMISAAPGFDKLGRVEDRKAAYLNVFQDGADILETDLPIEAGVAIAGLLPKKSAKRKFFKTKTVQNYLPHVH